MSELTTNGSKHTPGPWEVWEGHYSVYATGPNTENERGWITGTRRPICEMLEDTANASEDDDHEEMTANALIVAAAPELLAALQAQDDLERLRWLRDNSYPDQGNIHGEWDDIAARYGDVFVENDGWGWIIAKMETHVRSLRETALAKVNGE